MLTDLQRFINGFYQLDLHHVEHRYVAQEVHNFMAERCENLPVKIICGNSPRMKKMVITELHALGYECREGIGNETGTLLVIG